MLIFVYLVLEALSLIVKHFILRDGVSEKKNKKDKVTLRKY